MKSVKRRLLKNMEANLNKQKVAILLGARRVGKTVLLEELFQRNSDGALWLNGEDADVGQLLENRSIANYKRILGTKKLLIIDEAQYIPDINRMVKLMIDEIKPLHIILTGSSAFELQQQGEPLVGRSITYNIYPIAQMELMPDQEALETKQDLEDRLIFGSYPEVLSLKNTGEKKSYLRELVNSWLLKDILAFQDVRQPKRLKDLLFLLAHQVGSEVSVNKIGKELGLSKNTIERYLDLLTKVFVIYDRSGYSNNLRKEVARSRKYYFFDNGVRNALLNNFNPLALRQDVGALWEQYILSERIKRNTYLGHKVDSYFWRTYDQQEIDLIEAEADNILAIECKWKSQNVRKPEAFTNNYPNAKFQVISSENYLDWITN